MNDPLVGMNHVKTINDMLSTPEGQDFIKYAKEQLMQSRWLRGEDTESMIWREGYMSCYRDLIDYHENYLQYLEHPEEESDYE